MTWQKQTKFKKSKSEDEEKPIVPPEIYYNKFILIKFL